MNIKAFKVASTDNDNYPFISFLKKFRKPIILSTAMSNFDEVEKAYKLLKSSNFKNFGIMQCTGNYPTKIENVNLNVIDVYNKKFKCPIGFSDHTQDSTSAIASVGKGVKIIEKHTKNNKKRPHLVGVSCLPAAGGASSASNFPHRKPLLFTPRPVQGGVTLTLK